MAVGQSESATDWQFAEVRWWWPLRRYWHYLVVITLASVLGMSAWIVVKGPLFNATAVVEIKAGMAYPDPATPFLNHHRALASSLNTTHGRREDVRVDTLPGASLLAIHYRARDPQQARDGANEFAESYIALVARLQEEELERAALLMLRKLDSALETPLPLRDAAETDYRDGLVMALPGFVAADMAHGPLEAALIARLVQSYDQSLAQLPAARLLNAARLPEDRVWRIHPGWVLVAGLLAFAVPAIALVLRFRYRNTLDFPNDVEAALALPCLAWFPLIAGRGTGSGDEKTLDSAFFAGRHALRTAICLLRPVREVFELQPQGRVVLVTSGRAGEGKSTVARNLALGLADMEKVLLISADMRVERACCGLAAGAPGLSHLIAGAAQMRDCIHTPRGYGFDVIPAGVLPPDPAPLLSGKRFRRVLDMLQRRYDILVIDAPALENTQDAMLLARHCHDLLYVVTAGSRHSGIAAQLQRLTTSGIAVAGMVMNRMPLLRTEEAV